MLLRIFTILFPVFAVASLGYVYGRLQRPDMTVANQLNMSIFVPALVFSALANQSFELQEYTYLALAGVLVVLGSGLLVLPFPRLLKVDYRSLVPPMMFNNAGNVGLPLMLLAFGPEVLPAAVVLFLVEMTLHFTVGAYLMNPATRFLQLLRMPIVIATLLGLAVSISDVVLPVALETAIKMLADISIPLLLFALGVRLTDVSLKDWRLGVWSAILCPASGLIMVYVAWLLLPLPESQLSLLIIFGALPPAVLNYIVAEQYGQEPEKVASMVLLGNLGSLVVMPLALAFALS